MSLKSIVSRFPTRQEFFVVFSTSVFIAFSWSIYRLFFQVPSWLFYFNLTHILIIAAYVAGFTIFEAALLTGFLGLISLAYPQGLFRRHFVAQSIILLVALTIAALVYEQNIGVLKRWGLLDLILFIFIFLVSQTLVILAFSALFGRFPWLKRLLEALADRLTVFAWLYLPLSVVGLAVVIIRNLF